MAAQMNIATGPVAPLFKPAPCALRQSAANIHACVASKLLHRPAWRLSLIAINSAMDNNVISSQQNARKKGASPGIQASV